MRSWMGTNRNEDRMISTNKTSDVTHFIQKQPQKTASCILTKVGEVHQWHRFQLS